LVRNVDWTRPATFTEALTAAGRLSPESALLLGIALSEAVPIDQASRYFAVLAGRRLTSEQQHELFDAWRQIDPASVAGALMEAVTAGRLEPGSKWVEEMLGDIVLRYGRPADRASAVIRLVNVAKERRDRAALGELLDKVAIEIEGTEGRLIAGRVLEAMVALADPETADDLASRVIAYGYQGDDERSTARRLIAPLERSLGPAMREAAAGLIGTSRDEAVNQAPSAVTTAAEALDAARQAHPGVVILEEARRSAQRASSSNVRKLLDALLALGEVAEEWRGGEHEGTFEDALAARGIEYAADISDTAKTQYRSFYARRLPTGEEVLLGPHLIVGNRTQILRVYLYLDRQTRTVFIGHVGPHGPDKSSR
jgi:hypothetical protein